eukprot:4433442-Pleurochrysis_carterae.AAC.1
MLEVGDLWNCSLSALESYHAEVGQVVDRTGCKRQAADIEADRTLKSQPLVTEGREGPARIVEMR